MKQQPLLPSSFVILFSPFLLLTNLYKEFCNARDTITSSQFIRDPEYIVSNGSTFRLGFFSPVNSTNRYVGIWYNNINMTTPVWVANRGKPVNDSSGVLEISEDGNLVISNGRKEILWSSNVSNGVNSSIAVLTNEGNLVLQLGGNSIWESFQQPSDTFLSSMRLTDNKKTGKNVRITSWVSPSDPTVGRFSVGIDSSNIPQVFTWKDNHPYWRSGPWSGQVFIGIPLMKSIYLNGFTVAVVQEGDGTVWLRYSYENDAWLYSIILGYDGRLIERFSAGNGSLYSKGYLPDSECDIYGKCGEFGICNSQNSPICSCLKGFEPKAADDWNKGNWSSGCVKRAALQCERVENGSENRNEDGFLRVETVKVPDYAQWLSTSSEQDCRVQCLKNCSCKAYAYYSGFGCMIWTSNLIDIQQFSSGGTDLYIRLADSEFDSKSNVKVIISIPAVIGAIAMCICAFLLWKWRTKHRRNKQKIQGILRSNDNGANTSSVEGKMTGHTLDHLKIRELPLFTLKLLATATDNFDESNKLGKGGFGPVYKGKLQNGQEIAVKRLSRASGQGLEEFMNEVEVISKLQHKNLVRLFGCCTEGDEKMLVYEYMPNKSLDALLFDTHKRELLGWRKRFNIIEGVCRGLLYLHRDSRLKIIHRDLKASNILLDQEFNPKISDFGMARIFGGNEDQADTTRIVGTYGYMPPEYAIEGRFSEKSDVFSFGVLMLEIVSGIRSASFYDYEQGLGLLGFAWKLWNEGDCAALVDPVINDPCFLGEISRCIHIGLLCVQKLVKDRPLVSIVMSMLNSEITDLPCPKQPAFLERNFGVSTENFGRSSINYVTVTVVHGR